MGGAMQRKLDDAEAEPLLQQCRQMASDMEALRRSEQRYRALVGDDDAGDRCADREDPSTRAQCLHGIESALAALGVEESEEPAAAAIMRAAEEARAREEELHDRLDESAARGRALESKLSELTRAADTLQRALDGSVLAVGDEEDASAAGDRAVEALKRLCEDSVTASAEWAARCSGNWTTPRPSLCCSSAGRWRATWRRCAGASSATARSWATTMRVTAVRTARTLRRARSACTVSSLRWLPLAWRRVKSQRQRPS
ncbi:hypothetical protein C3747_578g33 [Trypanosoma cruzi]|uniref:Uncharacterized protein n=1 Tax=Trypanosoma cruzi TaxID=5693 RepID=A0A2V2UPC1_TRYCR|nr:hypothetical protein C3747_578g33 [Trypanosoma cruzi]